MPLHIPIFPGFPVHCIVTILIELSWLHNITDQYFITSFLYLGLLCPAMIENGLTVKHNALAMRYWYQLSFCLMYSYHSLKSLSI
jgi:hypothetical protein